MPPAEPASGSGAGLFLGLISGTSVDAIDAALVRFEPRLELVARLSHPYPPGLREQILALTQGVAPVTLIEVGRLDALIGAEFAAAAEALLAAHPGSRDALVAIGSHGQTVMHRPLDDPAFTMQLGDPNVIAERTGSTTVADFRRRDVAAGGHGAPLAPAFHDACLRSAGETRVVLNLGGIANVTVLPADPAEPISGFDTGPANCLLDAWAKRCRGGMQDDGGAWARSGTVLPALLARLLDDPYFQLPAPKSTGRDYFHLAWFDALAAAPDAARTGDVQATLAELTARTVAEAVRSAAPSARRVIACGGGVHNGFLMERLAATLAPVRLESSLAHGIDPDQVEAMAFAWLARETLAGRAGNRTAVTGARGPRVLGAIYQGAVPQDLVRAS